MKKALIYYLYGTKNAGDMAICAGAVELLKKLGYSITMVSRFSEAESEYEKSRRYMESYFPEVKVYPGPFSFERDFSLRQKLMTYAASFAKVCGVVPDQQNLSLIKEHDIVLFNGGNLLRGESMKDYMRLIALFYPIELAKKAGKPVYCLPQSTAGISRFGNRLLKRFLSGIRTIYVREKISLNSLCKSFPGMNFQLSTDMAFFCQDCKKAEETFRMKFGDMSDSGNVALILRNSGIGDIGRLAPETEKKLLSALETYVLQHPENEYWLVLQTLKDKAVSEIFLNTVKEKVRIHIVESHDPLVLRELYKNMSLTITMRLHAGILSLSALTPVVGLFSQCWGLKNPGVMSAYGMPYMLVEQGTESIEQLVEQIPSDASKKIHEMINFYGNSIVFDTI